MPKETRTVIEHAHPSSFPILRNIRSSSLRLRPEASIRLEVNADCLPQSLHPYLHVTWMEGGMMKRTICAFIFSLHPSYAFGEEEPDANIIQRLGGVEAATSKMSELIEAKSALRLESFSVYVEMTLRVGDHGLRGIMVPFSELSRALERGAQTAKESTQRIPPPRKSNVQARQHREAVDRSAEKAMHGRRSPKQRKAG